MILLFYESVILSGSTALHLKYFLTLPIFKYSFAMLLLSSFCFSFCKYLVETLMFLTICSTPYLHRAAGFDAVWTDIPSFKICNLS